MLDADPDDNYNFFSYDFDQICRYVSAPEYNDKYNKNSLSMVNSNVRSFKKIFSTLSSIFHSNNFPSIFCLSETQFTTSYVRNIDGYKPFHTIRNSATPAGGISLFIDDRFKPSKINSLSYINDTIERKWWLK